MRSTATLAFLMVAILLVPNNYAGLAFPIDEGVMISEGWHYSHFEVCTIFALNVSIEETIAVTSISDTIVQFDYDLEYAVEEAYQIVSGSKYNATSYGLRFYDDEMQLVGTGESSFEMLRQVRKGTGERILSQVPYGASFVEMAAYFDEPTCFEYTAISPAWQLEAVGSVTTVYLANSSTAGIGVSAHPEFNISGDGEYQGYETWVAQANETPPAVSAFSHQIQFEKNSGLRLKEDMFVSVTGEFSVEYHMRATQFADLISSSPTDSDGFALIIMAAGSAVGIGIIAVAVILKRS
ncbi:MAG: hypothetical protein ACFFCK_10660 [Promethearchaeota archaeon]